MGDNVCDLGTSTNQFKDGYFGGGLTYTQPFAEMYRNVATVDSTWSGTTPHKAIFTSTTANADNVLFTHTTNRITYTGTKDKMMHTAATFSIFRVVTLIQSFRYINGVLVPGSLSTVTNGVSVGNALHSAFRMVTNDYAEVWIARLSGTANCTMSQMNLFAGALGNGF